MAGFLKWEEVFKSSLESDESFRETLKKVLRELRLDIKEFSRISGISESSLYKIISGDRPNPRLSTFREIVKAIRKLENVEGGREPFIAIIAARPTLDSIQTQYISVHGQKIKIKEYGATTIEDVIIAALNAEQEGAKAIVCAPIVSTTLEKIVKVPISACPVLLCSQPLLEAAKTAAAKILGEETKTSRRRS